MDGAADNFKHGSQRYAAIHRIIDDQDPGARLLRFRQGTERRTFGIIEKPLGGLAFTGLCQKSMLQEA